MQFLCKKEEEKNNILTDYKKSYFLKSERLIKLQGIPYFVNCIYSKLEQVRCGKMVNGNKFN